MRVRISTYEFWKDTCQAIIGLSAKQRGWYLKEQRRQRMNMDSDADRGLAVAVEFAEVLFRMFLVSQ